MPPTQHLTHLRPRTRRSTQYPRIFSQHPARTPPARYIAPPAPQSAPHTALTPLIRHTTSGNRRASDALIGVHSAVFGQPFLRLPWTRGNPLPICICYRDSAPGLPIVSAKVLFACVAIVPQCRCICRDNAHAAAPRSRWSSSVPCGRWRQTACSAHQCETEQAERHSCRVRLCVGLFCVGCGNAPKWAKLSGLRARRSTAEPA